MVKRFFDMAVAGGGLLLLAPFFLIIAVLIRLQSPGPVFFRQQRVGRAGKVFRIHKFRTMHTGADLTGPSITLVDDHRITGLGRILRRYKVDELPQLIDVLKGDMSLVGPRPEVPEYVALYPASVRRLVLSVRPGITDTASLHFFDESELLQKQKNPERYYQEELIPIKLQYAQHYIEHQSLIMDIRIILMTIIKILPRSK